MPPKPPAGLLYLRYVMLLFLEVLHRGSSPAQRWGVCSGCLADKAMCIAQPVLELSLQPKIV